MQNDAETQDQTHALGLHQRPQGSSLDRVSFRRSVRPEINSGQSSLSIKPPAVLYLSRRSRSEERQVLISTYLKDSMSFKAAGEVQLPMNDSEKQLLPAPPAYQVEESPKRSSNSVWRARFRGLFLALLAYVALVKLLGATSGAERWLNPHHHRHHRGGGGRGHGKHLSAAEAEKLYLSIPDPKQIKEYSRSYTSFAHYAGTEGALRSAKITENRWSELLGVKSEGVLESGTSEAQEAIRGMPDRRQPSVHVDTYHSLLNYPLGNSSLSMSAPNGTELFKAKLFEPPVKGDETSQNGTLDVPLFHGFSKAGAASGQLVYANMGRVEDYEMLQEKGIDLQGKIAIVRYGGTFRGLKISAGEMFGIAGEQQPLPCLCARLPGRR